MTCLVKGVFIIAAKRTPFCNSGGRFIKISATELQTISIKAALSAANVKPELIDSVIIGNVLTCSFSHGGFLARHAALNSGISEDRPALLINRLCGSGFQTIISSVQDILTATSQISIAGGVENISQSPHICRNLRFGVPLDQNIHLEDSLSSVCFDTHCKMSMGLIAEKLGAQYNLTRDEVDAFALKSQQKWANAKDAGFFQEELASVKTENEEGSFTVDVDGYPRPQCTLEALKTLPSTFKENGLITIGNSSGFCDGSGAIIIASEEATLNYNLKPLGRIVSFSTVGVEPSMMGFGPVPAIRNILKASGKTLNDVDLIEINEDFAVQTLACVKELELDLDKLNVDGGAIAIGHPLGASGIRITAHLVHELRRRKAKLGIGSACIGGGQGIAIMVEAL